MFPTKFRFIWQSGFRGEYFFRNQPISLLKDQEEISTRSRGLSIDASYQVSIHLAKRYPEEKNLKNQPIRNKNRLWRPCLLTDRDGMSNLYRRPSIYSSYQVSDHLDKWFQRRFCICNTNSDWVPRILLLKFQEDQTSRTKVIIWKPLYL
jgi:hypothetical protein